MKFNLKTAPKIMKKYDPITDLDIYNLIVDMGIWLQGFEKELREKIKEHKDIGSIGADIIASELEEILGE